MRLPAANHYWPSSFGWGGAPPGIRIIRGRPVVSPMRLKTLLVRFGIHVRGTPKEGPELEPAN